jgi:hypothetical protein
MEMGLGAADGRVETALELVKVSRRRREDGVRASGGGGRATVYAVIDAEMCACVRGKSLESINCDVTKNRCEFCRKDKFKADFKGSSTLNLLNPVYIVSRQPDT